MPSTSGFDFSGMAAGMGATSNNSAHAFTDPLQGATALNPDPVAKDALEAKLTGKMTQGEYFAHQLEAQSAREAREWEKKEADTAWQRKIADLMKAGFSPLAALDATGQGAAVASSQVAKASSSGSSLQLGAILGAIVGAIGIIASRGVTAAASAKNAASLEALRQNNRVALEAIRQNGIASRSQVHSFSLTDPHGIRHTYTNRGAKKKNPLDFW